jgi:hypothetical protein
MGRVIIDLQRSLEVAQEVVFERQVSGLPLSTPNPEVTRRSALSSYKLYI